MAILEVWEGYLEVVFELSETGMTRVDWLYKEMGGQCSWQRSGVVQRPRWAELPSFWNRGEGQAQRWRDSASYDLQKLLELAEENKPKSGEG